LCRPREFEVNAASGPDVLKLEKYNNPKITSGLPT
jgi:hypothetical protein